MTSDAELVDVAPKDAELLNEVLRGLAKTPKALPCKLFYDKRGSALFDRICELDEYYLTRTELLILKEHAEDIAKALGPRCTLIEFGSGSGLKTQYLLEHLLAPTAYVPIDISRAPLLASTNALRKRYSDLRVLPVHADYTREFALPEGLGRSRRAVFFPGSTIGNFDPPDAVSFLSRVHEVCCPGGHLLIGVDLKKDPRVLEAAYNDKQGVTAEFNRNILRVVNRVTGSSFDPSAFRHSAVWNNREGRIEMRLLSERPQRISVAHKTIPFEANEVIVTEHCYKYTISEFEYLAASAGFAVRKTWHDPRHYFAVMLLTAV